MSHNYLPGLTPLPIGLTCIVTGVAVWSINGTRYTLTDLTIMEHCQDIIVLEQILVNT